MKFKLQVFKDGNWEYVFCHNRLSGIVITKDPKKALLKRDLKHFESKFGNDKFRTKKG